MKIHPQTIYRGHEPEFVVLPIRDYNRLIASLEDFQDIHEVQRHIDEPSENFPMEVAIALSDGNHPIKVFREYRGLTQAALASRVNVSKQYISQLENGDRSGTTRVLKAIARVLKVDLDDITD